MRHRGSVLSFFSLGFSLGFSLVFFTGLFLWITPELSFAETPELSIPKEINEISEVGKHHRILIVEKSENPQNQIAVFTKVDRQCRFIKESDDTKRPVLDFYWLLDRKRYKPIGRFAKYRVRKKIRVHSLHKEAQNSFFIFSDLIHRYHPELRDSLIEIKSEKRNGHCEVAALAHLEGLKSPMKLEKVYSELKKTFFPPFRKVLSITLNGESGGSGVKIRKTYRGG